jgi:hypothetical protein
MEEQLAQLLDRLGYAGARDQVKILCRSGASRALQFLIDRVKTEDEKQRIDGAVHALRLRQAREAETNSAPSQETEVAELEEELSRKKSREEALQRTLASYQVISRRPACGSRVHRSGAVNTQTCPTRTHPPRPPPTAGTGQQPGAGRGAGGQRPGVQAAGAA